MAQDTNNYMTTLSTVMDVLRQRGIEQEFIWSGAGMTLEKGKFYQPEDLTIIKIYRFEGQSDPGDNAILYVIRASDEVVGYCLDSYGVYSNQENTAAYNSFLQQIRTLAQEEQIDFLNGM